MAEQTIFLGPRDVIGAALIKRAERDDVFRAELMRDPHTAVERALGLLLPGRLHVQVQMPVEQSAVMGLAMAVAGAA